MIPKNPIREHQLNTIGTLSWVHTIVPWRVDPSIDVFGHWQAQTGHTPATSSTPQATQPTIRHEESYWINHKKGRWRKRSEIHWDTWNFKNPNLSSIGYVWNDRDAVCVCVCWDFPVLLKGQGTPAFPANNLTGTRQTNWWVFWPRVTFTWEYSYICPCLYKYNIHIEIHIP